MSSYHRLRKPNTEQHLSSPNKVCGYVNITVALGHPQPPTPILCDNWFAIGLATDTIKQKMSKCIDMHFHWLRDKIRQSQFTITHLTGKLNLADFLTKAMSCAHHQKVMPWLVYSPSLLRTHHARSHWHLVTYRRRNRYNQPQWKTSKNPHYLFAPPGVRVV
jgi:hypothetical protein